MKRFWQDEALCMKTRRIDMRPALTPLEAAMLPAGKCVARGALRLARASFAPGNQPCRGASTEGIYTAPSTGTRHTPPQ